jgi:hypothetical protein
MKKLLLLAAISISSVAIAQVNYQRVYSTAEEITNSDIAWSSADQSYVMSSLDSSGVTLFKVDATGLPMWNRHFYFPGRSLSHTAQLAIGGDGNIYTCTQASYMTSGGDVSYLVLATDQWMTPLWSKVYTTQSTFVYDQLEFSILPDGNLMITESVSGHVGYIKTDLSGNVIASNMYRDDPQTEAKGPGFDGAVFPDGSMVFTGKRDSDIMVVRTNATGTVMWSRVMNDGMNYYHTKSVAAMSDGSSIMGGFSYGGAFLMRMDANGATTWYKEFTYNFTSGGTFYDVQQVDANSFMAIGNFGQGNILVKFDLNGQLLSAIEIDTNSMYARGSAHYTINPSGFIAWPFFAYDPSQSWHLVVGLTVMSSLNSNGCGIEAVATQQNTGTVVPSELTIPIYTVAQVIADTFVTPIASQRVVQMEEFCWLIGMEDPTPTPNFGLSLQSNLLTRGSALNFSLQNFTGDAIYTIHDLNGREVAAGKTSANNGNQISIPEVATFANGMYVLSVVAGENRMSEKFVVH